MAAKISIIIPIYNDDQYLGRCLSSVMKQTYHNIEIVLVDDGSTDQSLVICQQYVNRDPRFKLIVQANQGVSAARNTGLSYATGDYICFVDGDDFINPDYCSSLFHHLRNDDADIAVNSYIFCRKGKYYVILQPAPNDSSYNRVYSPTEWLRQTRDNFDVFLPVIMWGKLFKRPLFDEVRFPVNLTIAEDAATIWLLYLRAHRISFFNKATYFYCAHEQSAVHTKNPSYAQWRILCQQLAVLGASEINSSFLNGAVLEQLAQITRYPQQSVAKNAKLLRSIIQHAASD